MASANITMGVTGIDKTGAAFNSVKARARATGAQIRSIVGGAIAAAGAYLGVRAIKGGIDELGKLSDMATKAGTSVETLTQASTALSVLGIQGANVESLAQSFAMMEKNTGKSGMDGFKEVIGSIAQIPDAAERAQAAVQVFGRSGLNFMPLINGAKEGTDALDNVVKAMPKISDAAAQAGDAASDALKIGWDGIKSITLEALGKLISWIGSFFPGGIRGAMASASAYVEYGCKMAFISVQRAVYSIYNYTMGYVEKLGAGIGAVFGTWFGEGGFVEGFENFGKAWSEQDAKLESTISELDKLNNDRATRWENDLQTRLEAISKLGESYGKAAKTRGAGFGEEAGDTIGAAAAKAATRISNQLITGNSNAAQRLSILGPNYQNEQKKQTSILEKIEKNTAKSADNSESETYAATDLT